MILFFALTFSLRLADAGSDTVAILKSAQQLHRDGNLTAARGLYEQVIPRLRAEGDRRNLAGALYLVSLAYTDLGEYSRALEAASESAGLRKAAGEKAGEADSTNSIGLALLNLGDYPKAKERFQSALDLYRGVGDLEEAITVLNNLANVFLYQGKYLEALDRYQKAMDLVGQTSKEEWNPHELQVTTANMAVLYQKLGRYDLALDQYARLRATSGVLSPAENGRVLANLGAIYRHLGDPIKALETYSLARQYFTLQKNYSGEMGVLKNIGIAQALDLNNLQEALKSFTQVLQLARQTANRREVIQAHLYMGEVLRRLMRAGEARGEFGEALSGARDLGTVEEEWKALYGLGRVEQDARNDAQSLILFRQAIALIESVRSRIRLSSLKAEFLADKRTVYDAAIATLLKSLPPAGGWDTQPGLEEIHRLMEGARARNFKDQLFDTLESLQGRANPELAGRLRELRAQLALNRNRQVHAAGAALDRLREEYSVLEGKYIEIERRLAGLSPNRLYDSGPTLGEIQSRLPGDTLLLETWTGEGTFAGIWISHSEAGIVQKQFTAEDEKRLRECAGRISDPSAGDWRPVCSTMGEMLLKEVLPQLGGGLKNLIIVPDDKLAALPVEVLPLPANGGLLIERINVSYLPSSSMISSAGDSVPLGLRMPWAATLLAFGDPVYSGAGKKTGSMSMDEDPPPLAFSRYEVESIAREIRGRKRLHFGQDAVKKHLLEGDAHSFRLIHLSTHARADLENPQGSRILFSPESEGAPADNLFLGEILNLNLQGTELVTLSACETGRGRTSVGEGPQDFSRAFLMSGSNTCVATLWRVADQPTAEFMKQFYYYLGDGNTKTQALRLAKLKFIRAQEPLSHPFYWAAFVLSGEAVGKIAWPVSWGAFLALSAALLLAGIALLQFVLKIVPRIR